ncbi:MAG: ABC transporter permease subunit, partial [Actinobacteria bacterium]|nr:ABC transporter permease subunit [Actinomycetota bacterium]
LVHLRFPRLRSLLEILCLFPLVIPPVVLVVGVRTVLGWGPDQLAGTPLQSLFNTLQNTSLPWILALEYVVLALPFTYRALDAGLRSHSITTLVEAARNLGSSWPDVVLRVVLPTLRTSLLNAAFLAFALVLGEFTIASILLYQTFTVWILQFNDTDGQLSVAVSLMSLLITWLLLIVIAVLGRGRNRKGSRG